MKWLIALIVAVGVASPAAAQLSTTHAGGSGASSSGPLTPPTLLPQPGVYLDSNQATGYTANGFQLNGGVSGAFSLPSTVTQSMAVYLEGQINTNPNEEYALGSGTVNEGLIIDGDFLFQTRNVGASGTSAYFWNATNGANGVGVTAGSGYIQGLHTWTGSGCQSTGRNPTGVVTVGGTNQLSQPGMVDLGILCPTATVNVPTISGIGAPQGTGTSVGLTATACASNTPTSSSFTVTANVVTPHGVNPGGSFTLAGFNSGYNVTYAALGTTTSATLVGAYDNTTGTCPNSGVPGEGTVGAGTGGAINITAQFANPFLGNEGTGISYQAGQRFCGVIGEFGSETGFPGAQFAEFTDQTGTELPGSPFVDPWLNQGVVTFNGYTTTTQPSLTVTSLPTTAITNAVYNAGYVTFTTGSGASTYNGMIIGSEFTVSGVTSTGTGTFNGTYVAVAGTNETTGNTLVGNLLTGPAAYPTAFTGSPTYSSGGTLVGVIMPGMEIPGATGYALIAPYGTNSSTGTGGAGTYQLTVTQAQYATAVGSFSTTSTNGSVGTLTVTSGLSASENIIIGTTITATTGTGTFATATVTNYGTGTGGNGTYGVNQMLTVTSGTLTIAGTIGSSGTPVPIFAAAGYYASSVTPGATNGSTNSSGWAGGQATIASSLGDIMNLIGTQKVPFATTNYQGWGGSLANIGMYQGSAWPNSNGSVTTSALNSLCTKTTDFQAFATANGGAWRSLYRLNDGVFGDSGIAQFNGTISGTSLTINSIQSASTASLIGAVIAGAGITGCDGANNCPTVASGTNPNYTLNTSGGSVTGPMTAGTYKRAKPIAALPQFQGQITAGSTPTLTVNSMTNAFACTSASSLGGANWPYTTLTLTGCSATPVVGAIITDGGVNITGSPLIALGESGTAPNVTVTTNTNDYAPFSGDTTIVGTSAQIVPGQWLLGAGITTPVQVIGYGPPPSGNLAGTFPQTYLLSNNANGVIGAENMSMAGIAPSGTIAPGAALTVNNTLGPYTTFSINNFVANTGSVNLAGTYNTGLLGGTPSAIQAQFSYTPNGPAVSGCTPCAWTTLTGDTISGGNWSGTAVNIPGGGPYWVSIRPANGTAYSTLMPNPITMGVNVAVFGNGGLGGLIVYSGGSAAVTYKGLSTTSGFGLNSNGYDTGGALIGGPPILGISPVNPPTSTVADTFGANGLSNPSNYIPDSRWGLTTSASAGLSGDSVGMAYMIRNGSSLIDEGIGNTTQTQTIGIGDNSTTTFASGTLYGAVSPATTKTATITVSTAGVMNVTAYSAELPLIAPGQGVTCSGCPTGMVVTGYDGATGAAGNYWISPAPGSALGARTGTFTSNGLTFNTAYLTGSVLNGTTANSGGSGLCASLPCLTVNSVSQGHLAPGLVLTDNSGTTDIPANTTVTGCVSGCGPAAGAASVWELSNTVTTPETAAMYLTPIGGAPMPSFNFGLPPVSVSGGGDNGTNQTMQHGTFSVSVNGTVVCKDNSAFAYNQQSGPCTPVTNGVATVTSGWVSYYSGSFQIVFASPPSTNAMIVASWKNIQTADVTYVNENLDVVGSGGLTGGQLSSIVALTGGITAYTMGFPMIGYSSSYQSQAIGVGQMMARTFGTANTQLAALPNDSAGAAVVTQGYIRVQGILSNGNSEGLAQADQLMRDMATASTWSATVVAGSPAVMTLTTPATGPLGLWEGEQIGCAPFTLYCASGNLPVGSQITSLVSGTWGANGSKYNIAPPSGGTIGNIASAIAMQNATYYSGAGPVYYTGPLNDIPVSNGAAGLVGSAGESNAGGPYTGLRYGERVGAQLAAQMSGNPNNARDPTLSRSATAPGGCDAAATGGTAQASPCFDIGTGSTTYNAVSPALNTAWSGSTITITGGLTAGSRPFVPGMALSCVSCNSGLVAIAVSLPPTQSTATGAGQIGQTFTVTASGTIGGLGTGAVTGGCSGTSGSGSNCIDVAFTTYTGTALATCGVNNLQGYFNGATAGSYVPPNGRCTNAGIGDLVSNFRIGSAPDMSDGATGNVYDIGVDPMQTGNGNIVYNQSNGFTCNLVAAKVVQCVSNPTYVAGVFSTIGKWLSGQTYIEYGDAWGGTAFQGTLVPPLGGQGMPITTPGSSYTNGQYVVGGNGAPPTTAGSCGVQGGGAIPSVIATITSGGISSVYPYSSGLAATLACTFPSSVPFTGVYTASSHTLVVTALSGGTLVAGENIFDNATGGFITTPMKIVSGPNTFSFSGGISSTTMTVVSGTPTIPAGSLLSGTGVTAGTYVVSGSGTSYVISPSQTVSSGTAITAAGGGDGSYIVTYTGGNISSEGMTAGLPQNGSGAAITQATLQPLQGQSGIATYANDSNLMGIQLYDNSCLSGGSLASQCGNAAGGYVSPGMPVWPFGQYLGAQVQG